MKNGEKKIRSNGVKEVFQWFFYEFTTFSGITQIRATNLKLSKIIWFILFITGLVLTTINVKDIIREYFMYRVNIRSNFLPSENIEFPAITFCNNNIVHCGNLQKTIFQCLNESSQSINCENLQLSLMCKFYNEGNCKNRIQDTEIFQFGKIQSYLEICHNVKEFNATPHLSMLTQTNRIRISHQVQQMIVYCQKGLQIKESCKELKDGIVKFQGPHDGTCYSFNFNKTLLNSSEEFHIETSSVTGFLLGLGVFFNLETGYYYDDIRSSEGLKIYIHDSNYPPLIKTDPFLLMKAEHNMISLRKDKFKRLKEPYFSRCRDKWNEDYLKYLNPNTKYSTKLCRSICFDANLYENCGCMQALEIGTKYHKSCQDSDRKCLSRFYGDPAPIPLVCPTCTPQCNEVVYKATVSNSKWPTESNWMSSVALLGIIFNNTKINNTQIIRKLDTVTQNKLRKHMDDNYGIVEIFYEALVEREIEEIPHMPGFSALSKIGGALGLYLGGSLIVMFEFYELLLRLILIPFKKFCKCKHKSQPRSIENCKIYKQTNTTASVNDNGV